MKRVSFLAMMLVACVTLSAQQPVVQPDDPAFIAKYANLDFRGRFALAVDKDASNNYFLLDFSKLSTRFEKVCYMNLSFTYHELVNIDPDITKTRVCFSASRNYAETEVIKLFDEIKEKVNSMAASWSEDRKSDWMKSNDKYK